jgi:large subunit ribosomal protein L4
MENKVYNIKGIEAGKVKLPQEIFGLPWNADLVHQVAVSMMSNARQPIAHSKMRGEVRGGGKKPWRQKGTGRARHGSTRSPIWVGGGTTHGPRNDKDYSRKVNKKMKTKALFTILSRKVADGSLIFVDSLSFKEPKTADAKDVLTNLSKIAGLEKLAKKRTNALCIALSKKDITVEKSFRNIGSVKVEELRNVNPLDILNTAFLLIENPEESIKLLTGKSAK